MDDEARALVELAAVIGRTFDLGLLCKAAARWEDQAFGIIEPLVNSGLIVGVLGNTYHFSHDKLRQALYEGIGGPRRRALHCAWPRPWRKRMAGRPSWPTIT
jgi:predicted ATPase